MPYLCLESYLIVSMNVIICAGAKTDIHDEDGQTPLQLAEEKLADTTDPDRKQQYEKVNKGTHTCHTFIRSLNDNGKLVYSSSLN